MGPDFVYTGVELDQRPGGLHLKQQLLETADIAGEHIFFDFTRRQSQLVKMAFVGDAQPEIAAAFRLAAFCLRVNYLRSSF